MRLTPFGGARALGRGVLLIPAQLCKNEADVLDKAKQSGSEDPLTLVRKFDKLLLLLRDIRKYLGELKPEEKWIEELDKEITAQITDLVRDLDARQKRLLRLLRSTEENSEKGSAEVRRRNMVEKLYESGLLQDKRLRNAFLDVPRHMFVPRKHLRRAYVDSGLNTVRLSMISEPSTVARMLDMLDLREGQTVMELGMGSGFNACLLAYCVGVKGSVLTMEIDKEVFDFGAHNIDRFLASSPVANKLGKIVKLNVDGSEGSVGGLFDRIIYTAAAPKIPEVVIKQLNPGGKLVAPAGSRTEQALLEIEKLSDGSIRQSKMSSVQFVLLRGKHGFRVSSP